MFWKGLLHEIASKGQTRKSRWPGSSQTKCKNHSPIINTNRFRILSTLNKLLVHNVNLANKPYSLPGSCSTWPSHYTRVAINLIPFLSLSWNLNIYWCYEQNSCCIYVCVSFPISCASFDNTTAPGNCTLGQYVSTNLYK